MPAEKLHAVTLHPNWPDRLFFITETEAYEVDLITNSVIWKVSPRFPTNALVWLMGLVKRSVLSETRLFLSAFLSDADQRANAESARKGGERLGCGLPLGERSHL